MKEGEVRYCDEKEIGVEKDDHEAFIYDQKQQIWVRLLEIKTVGICYHNEMGLKNKDTRHLIITKDLLICVMLEILIRNKFLGPGGEKAIAEAFFARTLH